MLTIDKNIYIEDVKFQPFLEITAIKLMKQNNDTILPLASHLFIAMRIWFWLYAAATCRLQHYDHA